MFTRSGFTLLEVLVALAIVVMAWAGVAAALPRLVGASSAERVAEDVEALLRRARSTALAGSHPVVVRITEDGRTLAVPALDERVELPSSVIVQLDGVAGWGGSAARATALGQPPGQGSGAAIVFLPDGSSSGGRVILADAEAASDSRGPRSVHVSWLTGRVERR
jgi:prepilin-type N-terminal cleavage/methylation domain-containing protein